MKNNLRNAILLFSFFILFVALKYLVASNNAGPSVFNDELIYRINAEKIFHHEPLSSTHYPPLYPLSLSLTFFSKDYWYNWMFFINVLLSSLALIPIWLISIRFLPKSLSLIVLVLACLSSFHLYYPQLIMSENLYMPLFLFSVLLLFSTAGKNRKRNVLFNALFGGVMALGYLTKYLHLAAIPFFIILWWVRSFFHEDPSERAIIEKARLVDMLVVVLGAVFTYVPWVIYLQYSGVPVTQGMGSQFIRSGIPDYATLKSLFLWISFYASYIVLATAPYLVVFSLYVFMWARGHIKHTREETFFMIAVAVLSVVFLMTAVQHSWRASYNYPAPNRIMGRYLMHLSPLYLIIFMMALNKIKDSIRRLSALQITACCLLCLLSFFAALEMLFISREGRGLAFSFMNSPDGVMFASKIFTVLFLAIFVVIAGILIAGRRNILLSKHFVLLFSSLLMIFHLSISYKTLEQTLKSPGYKFHGRTIAEFLRNELKPGSEEIIIVNGDPEFPTKWWSPSIRFWLMSPGHDASIEFITINDWFSNKNHRSEKKYFLTRDHYGSPLYHYIVKQQNYYIYDLKSVTSKILL